MKCMNCRNEISPAIPVCPYCGCDNSPQYAQNQGYPQQGYPQQAQMNQGYPQPGQMNRGYPQPGQMNQVYPQPGQMNQGYPQPGQGARPQKMQNQPPGGSAQGNKSSKKKKIILISSISAAVVALAVVLLVVFVFNNNGNGEPDPETQRYIEKTQKADDISAATTINSAMSAALANEDAYDEIMDIMDGRIIARAYPDQPFVSASGNIPVFLDELNANVGGKSPKMKYTKQIEADVPFTPGGWAVGAQGGKPIVYITDSSFTYMVEVQPTIDKNYK